MPNLVEVPENAVREEPLAFGMTAPQLLVCGIAVAIGAVIQLLPVWVALQIVLTVLLAGPVVLSAILPIRGEPAYRWLIRWIRYVRGPRTLDLSDRKVGNKSGISGDHQDPPIADQAAVDGVGGTDPIAVLEGRGDPPAIVSDLPGEAQTPMGERAVRLKVVDTDDGEPEMEDREVAGVPLDRPWSIPHALPTMRVVAVAGFAGGTGRTTLVAEIATLVGSHARIRGLDGADVAVRVLVLDAARLAGAVGLRLGLAPAALARARGHRLWRDPGAIADLAAPTRWRTDVLTLPPHPQLGEHDGAGDAGLGQFGAAEAGELVEGAQRAGYHLLVVDLGSLLEEGHRELVDQADLVLGVVRPTLESLPDVFRLATVMRAQGMGRKLTLVASGADDDTEIRRLAREADVPVAGCVRPDPVFTTAADRGEPAWAIAPQLLRGDLEPVARAAWPLLADGQPQSPRRRSVLGVVRATIPTSGGTR